MMPMMGKTYSFTPIMGNYGDTEATWCKDTHSSHWAKGACTKAASMLSVMGGKAKRWRGNRKQAFWSNSRPDGVSYPHLPSRF